MKTMKETWKPVTISGITGILMGAGAMNAVQKTNALTASVESDEQVPGVQNLDDMSFREAFDTARAELGPGGVFRWHGNIYNTYTASEWKEISKDDQDAFVEEVNPEISAADVDTSNMAEVASQEEPDVKVTEEPKVNTQVVAESDDVAVNDDDDVRVIGYGDVELEDGRVITVQELEMNGQRVAVVDLDHDGTPDVAMSDLNQNHHMDDGEVIDLHTGEALSFTNDDIPLDNATLDTFDA